MERQVVIIEYYSRVIGTSATYSGSPGFEYQPEDQICWHVIRGFPQTLHAISWKNKGKLLTGMFVLKYMGFQRWLSSGL
jgi:hypothetical protein